MSGQSEAVGAVVFPCAASVRPLHSTSRASGASLCDPVRRPWTGSTGLVRGYGEDNRGLWACGGTFSDRRWLLGC